jgi:hypothetical protein
MHKRAFLVGLAVAALSRVTFAQDVHVLLPTITTYFSKGAPFYNALSTVDDLISGLRVIRA